MQKLSFERGRKSPAAHALRAVALGALTFAVACGSDDKPKVEPGFANLRAIHLVQGGPDVDIVLDQSETPISGLEFTDSSDYHQIKFGTYALEVRNSSGEVLATTQVTLDDQQSYTLAIYGAADGFQTQLFQDTFDIPSGEIRARLFNMAIGRGSMALYLDDDNNPRMLTQGVAYGQASDPAALEDGDHTFGLDVDLDGTVDATYDLPPLSDGTLANVFATFDENGDLDLVLQLNDGFTWDINGEGNIGTQARVRVIHLISNGPAVTITGGGVTVASDLAFMEQSPYAGIPAGTTDLTVGTSSAAALVTVMSAQLESGQSYTVVLYGSAAMPSAELIEDSSSNIPSQDARVRLIHAAVDVGELDFFDVVSGAEPTALATNLNFGDISDPVDLSAGTHRIGVDINNDNAFDAFFDTPSLQAGQLANLYAIMDNGSPRLVTQTDSSVTPVNTTMP